MAMNREQRRYLQKQGQIDAEGNPVARTRADARAPVRGERVGPADYVREVQSELRRVNWPSRAEVINYTLVVLMALVFFTGLIALFDFVFGEGVIQVLRQAQ